MALVPSTSTVPPGGFHFLDRTGPEPVRVEGDSFDDVTKKTLVLRLQNGRPPGNPGQELVDYVCGTWPSFCRENSPPLIPANISGNPPFSGLAMRAATWIAGFVGGNRGDPGISSNETQRRADICCACPNNQEFRGGCGSCVDNINRVFFVWRRNRTLPREAELGACAVIGQHNGAACLASQLPDLPNGVRERLPDRCWRKN